MKKLIIFFIFIPNILFAGSMKAIGSKGQEENIDRVIKKAETGQSSNLEEIRYEGYASSGIAIIVDALTDNRNRTAAEVRSSFTKYGGTLGETGSVSFMFNNIGQIRALQV